MRILHGCSFLIHFLIPWISRVIYIYIYMFFPQLLESKKWGKLTSFGINIFFLNSWILKNVQKLINLGVDGLKFRTIIL